MSKPFSEVFLAENKIIIFNKPFFFEARNNICKTILSNVTGSD